MEKQYLSIKEFAEAVGISQQAVYKQLKKKLKTYLKIVDGKKMLDKSALELFQKKEESTDIQQQLLNMLQTELNEKNKQIEELQKLLDQSQQLLAMDKQKILELEAKVEEISKKSEIEVENVEMQEPKKRWWQKIFY